METEYHLLDSRSLLMQQAKNWLLFGAVMVAVVMAYGLVQQMDEAQQLRAQVNAFKSRGCPETLNGIPFKFSAHETVNILRPNTTRLSCYYGGKA